MSKCLKTVFLSSLVILCLLASVVAQEKAEAADSEKPAKKATVEGIISSIFGLGGELTRAKEPPSTHRQTRIISIPVGDAKQEIHTFCVDPRGRLLCCCGGEQISTKYVQAILDPDGNPVKGEIPKKDGKPVPGYRVTMRPESSVINTPTAIRVASPEGKLLETWELDFPPQSINIGPDGFVYCGGAGKVAKLTLDGKVVKVVDTPNIKDMPLLPEVPEKIELTDAQKKERREKAKKLQKRNQELMNEYQKLHKRLMEEVSEKLKKEKGKLLPQDTRELYEKLEQNNEYMKIMEEMSEVSMQSYYAQMTPMEEAIQTRLSALRRRRVSGVAINDKDVFICCSPPKGYGFQVWRCDRDLENPKMIVANLRGCCGQMDIQAHGEKLYVAENARKKVVVYDRDGKRLARWGGDGADGLGLNFGSCCNPMNLCFDHEGNVLTSESGPGVVKRFSPKGEFLGRVGRVKVVPGCKHVAIDVADKGNKVYMLDITRKHIVLMEPIPEVETAEDAKDSKESKVEAATSAEAS